MNLDGTLHCIVSVTGTLKIDSEHTITICYCECHTFVIIFTTSIHIFNHIQLKHPRYNVMNALKYNNVLYTLNSLNTFFDQCFNTLEIFDESRG